MPNSGKVRIEHLRSIKRLEFELPEPGAWVLAGQNGAGKSSLLAVLWRIGSSEAFRRSFPSSSDGQLDSFAKTRIIYFVNGKSVSYRRTVAKWPPTPRKNAVHAGDFGYKEVIFVGADADRISPNLKEFRASKGRPAEDFIKDGLKQVFSTDKFDRLKVVNVTRGRMTPAYILPSGKTGGKAHYFSERNFSLGVLCVLKMLDRLSKIGQKSDQTDQKKALILIDELDMALHPVAQIGLFEFLKKLARDHGHTIIISTHSPAIIKSVELGRLIYLNPKDNGEVEVIMRPNRRIVLEGVSGDIHVNEGSKVYCEDEMAQACIIRGHRKWLNLTQQTPKSFNVLSIGSWKKTIEMSRADETDGLSYFGVVDADVTDEQLQNHLGKGLRDVKFARLPITPELGIAHYCLDRDAEFVRELHSRLLKEANSSFDVKLVKATVPQPDKNQNNALQPRSNTPAARQSAKGYLKNVKVELSKKFSIPEDRVGEALMDTAIELEFADEEKLRQWKKLFGQMYDNLK